MRPARTLFSPWPDWCERGKPSSPACSYVLYLFPLSSARYLNYEAWGSPHSQSCEMTQRVWIHANTSEFQAYTYEADRTTSEIKLDCDLHALHFRQFQRGILPSGLHFVKAWMRLQSCRQKINTTTTNRPLNLTQTLGWRNSTEARLEILTINTIHQISCFRFC